MSNNLVRFAGIAGILSAVSMIGWMFTIDPETFMPSSPLFPVFLWGDVLFGIMLTIGLYQLYRQEAATVSLIAAGVSIIGYALYAVSSFSWKPGSMITTIGDMAIFIVGVALFSWLAYTTKKLSRFLAFAGFLGALSGAIEYALMFTVGATAAAAEAVYYVYFLLTLVWLAWTGVSLLRAKTQTAMATA